MCRNSVEENEIILKAKNGDYGAFENLVYQYKDRVYNLALHILHNTEEAQDATQEIFIKLFINLATFREDAKFSTWLYKIASNTCLDKYRNRKKELERLSSDKEVIDKLPASNYNPEEVFQYNEELKTINRAISELPAKYRLVIILSNQQGLTYQEIANVLDIPVQTVGTQIYRAKAILKVKLQSLIKEAVK